MIPNPPLHVLTPFFADEGWRILSKGLWVGFLLGFAWLILRLTVWTLGERAGTPRHRMPAGIRLLVWVGIGALMVKQAGWQLLGRQNEAFVGFMQRYDRREFNPAHRVRAGKILDRNGHVLVESRVTDSGIRRWYRFGPIFSHLIGYNHPVYGLSGIESGARETLLGRELRSRDDLISLGAGLLDRESYAEGPALYTTLDLPLQRTAYEALAGRNGSIVILDVRSGAVRAMISQPDFDPNRLGPSVFNRSGSEGGLVNRAIQGRYPPGSVWKVLIAAASRQKGADRTLPTPPEGFTTSPSTPPIRDHSYYLAKEQGRTWKGYGSLNLDEALTVSSNVYFAQLGVLTGAASLQRAVSGMGFTSPVTLMSGSAPALRLPAIAGDDLSDQRPYAIAQFSIGQGELLVSPLQVAMLMAAVGNGGTSMQPRVLESQPLKPLGRLCTPAVAAQIRSMMRNVVTSGTGQKMEIPGLPVAGKTGTAEIGQGRNPHSWFAGLVPADTPRWAFCVLVEEGGYGSASALPIARDVVETAYRDGFLR